MTRRKSHAELKGEEQDKGSVKPFTLTRCHNNVFQEKTCYVTGGKGTAGGKKGETQVIILIRRIGASKLR